MKKIDVLMASHASWSNIQGIVRDFISADEKQIGEELQKMSRSEQQSFYERYPNYYPGEPNRY